VGYALIDRLGVPPPHLTSWLWPFPELTDFAIAVLIRTASALCSIASEASDGAPIPESMTTRTRPATISNMDFNRSGFGGYWSFPIADPKGMMVAHSTSSTPGCMVAVEGLRQDDEPFFNQHFCYLQCSYLVW
jgi:hypothetical protein